MQVIHHLDLSVSQWLLDKGLHNSKQHHLPNAERFWRRRKHNERTKDVIEKVCEGTFEQTLFPLSFIDFFECVPDAFVGLFEEAAFDEFVVALQAGGYDLDRANDEVH